jgi:hypothetical protein
MSDGTTGRRPFTALAAIGELTSTVSNSTLVNTLQAASSSERPNFLMSENGDRDLPFWWGEAPDGL